MTQPKRVPWWDVYIIELYCLADAVVAGCDNLFKMFPSPVAGVVVHSGLAIPRMILPILTTASNITKLLNNRKRHKNDTPESYAMM